VNSKKATNFKIWAIKVLKEYMIKGAVLNEGRLKNPNYIFGEDYFGKILEKIRNIRSIERRFYQKITDIILSVVLIMIKIVKLQKSSLEQFKINFIIL